MTDHTLLLIFMGVGLFILVLGIFTAIALLIYAVFEMKRMTATFNSSMKYAEEQLSPVLLEAGQFLRSVRKITDDAGAVTYAVRNVAEASNDVVINLKALSIILKGFGDGLSLRACGVKTGVKTAFNVLINQMKERRSYHER